MGIRLVLITLFFLNIAMAYSQQWHGITRSLHYKPQGTDFITTNGKQRFNRALYGTNTGFRIETGDLPEFALYLPGMGGHFRFGLIAGNKQHWLSTSSSIKTTYRPGCMLYEIKDPLLGSGTMLITVLALADAEGMLIKTQFINVTAKVALLWCYGGATGKKFSRDGDIGADPESSFDLQPEYCKGNVYTIKGKGFQLAFNNKHIAGLVPPTSDIGIKNATQLGTPSLFHGSPADTATPAIGGKLAITTAPNYFLLQAADSISTTYAVLPKLFTAAEEARKKLANRIKVITPDPYINTLGGALSIAADGIWESPTYMHGAIAWRMRLPAWRGAYVADVLGWHDRARTHFSAYAASQVTAPASGPVVFDTALHLARMQEQMGNAMFSSGYICRNPNGDLRPHHYDMNLVFIDQLLTHFYYTGDTAYVKQLWPVLQRHLAWEKRNFDSNNDGLYDAYCCIWASDALQYSGGGVTHSSAYNYRANVIAAELAAIIGADPNPYKQEATKISDAIQNHLWMNELGWYAEYKDALGEQRVHPSAGLWTIYHAIDSKVPDAFKAYQSLRYIDKHIPHIPVQATGLKDEGFYLLSTTNWQPYTWSLNNVALAENLHTALAYWQGNRSNEAFRLWKSAMVESMYMSASPGGFEQLSFYDAIRGELYRDFADPIGMAGRTLVEGLFGITPNAFQDTLTIKPGLPTTWNHAALQTPDINFDFKRTGLIDNYTIKPTYPKPMNLRLQLRAVQEDVEVILVNGKPVQWHSLPEAVGEPLLQIDLPKDKQYTISIKWRGTPIQQMQYDSVRTVGEVLIAKTPPGFIQSINDPQQILQNIMLTSNQLEATVQGSPGHKTAFIQIRQGAFVWWFPVGVEVRDTPTDTALRDPKVLRKDRIDLAKYFNDKVTNIFKRSYLSPRPTSPTLQLPTQGIGNWCYPLVSAAINDSGLRAAARANNNMITVQDVTYNMPGDTLSKNIAFTSLWDNYPDSVVVPLSGKAAAVYCMLAGSTNPMQSRFTNAEIRVRYTDGYVDVLPLVNPQNWWPIEQDYYIDSYAFTTGAIKPMRYYLKQGVASNSWKDHITIKGFSTMGIDGGAATILDLPLDPSRELQSLSVHALANDVVIGLMAVTLLRN